VKVNNCLKSFLLGNSLSTSYFIFLTSFKTFLGKFNLNQYSKIYQFIIVSGLDLSHKTSTIFHSGFFHSHFKILTATTSLCFASQIYFLGINISVLKAGLKGTTNQYLEFLGL